MDKVRAHPYVAALAAAAVLVVVGAIIVEDRSPVASQSATITWSGGLPTSAYQTVSTPTQTPQQIAQDVVLGQPEDLPLPTTTVTAAATNSSSFTPTSNSFDYVALLEALTASASSNQQSSSSIALNEQAQSTIAQAYEYIPQGLVAATTTSVRPMSAEQQTLYNYGNEVGGEIQSFEELHTNEAEVIKDQAEDRTDPTKAAAVVSLGKSLTSVGAFMLGMQNVPPDVQPLHNALAQSYIDIGSKLQLVPQAQTDQAFVQAVENYDSSTNTFVQNYAALSLYLSAQGVVFSQGDPGSIFTFNQNSSL